MTRRLSSATVILVLITGMACRADREQTSKAKDSSELVGRETRFAAALARDTASDSPLARWLLPPALAEISGLALTPDQRLLVHNDENGRVFEVDYRRGVVTKSFQLGAKPLTDDFEAIAIDGERLFMLTSHARLYEFKEGADGERVPFTLRDTGLRHDCDFEGLAFDSVANALVLACKHVRTKSLKEFVVLYQVGLGADAGDTPTQVKIPLADVIGTNGWKGFTPSDIAVDPGSGDYLIIASQEQGLLRVTPAGVVVWSRPLPPGHGMAEGVAITRDGLLIVSDEATSVARGGAITLYRSPGG